MKKVLKFLGGVILAIIAIPVVLVALNPESDSAKAERQATVAEAVAVAEAERTGRLSSVTFTSDPSGASLYINGTLVGVTPYTVERRVLGQEFSYKLVAQEPTPRYNSYYQFEGTFTPEKSEDGVSVWLERTSDEVKSAMEYAYVHAQVMENASITRYRCNNELVKPSLRNPNSAKFPPYYETSFIADGYTGIGVYKGYVDATNAFGGTVRTPFTCTYNLNSNTITFVGFSW